MVASQTVIAYNGVDGACAAAVAIRALPNPVLVVTSARRIAASLLALEGRTGNEVHICGVGIYCEWEELKYALEQLSGAGTRIHWYCGRGYLDEYREALAQYCEVVFSAAGTNTTCLALHFGLENEARVQRLVSLSWQDEHVLRGKPKPSQNRTDAFWVDFIHASMSQYFKFQDAQPYVDALSKLSWFEADDQDRTRVELFRRAGYRYLLQGDTDAVRSLKRRIKKCADADRHVLITGESGVGKEHVAHLLWEASPRAMGPLVAINCAHYAGNAGLANSDLFGHKKGAFTGADRDRRGKLAEADGGLLYLDELGELPLEVQAKLLRVLEDGKIMPEGADSVERIVDLRVIAATNRDLPARIRSGEFRADLYHRLSTLTIEVPPLRARRADIALITRQRLELLRQEGYPRVLDQRDLKALESYPWPGNVRQLIKVIERAVLLDMPVNEVLAEEGALGEDPRAGSYWPGIKGDLVTMEELQIRYAAQAYTLCGRQANQTAAVLQISTNTLRKYLRQPMNRKI